MSLVGTRPPTVDEWDKYELHHRARLATKPGLTGMWQVSGRSNITDFEEVVKLDKQYISEEQVRLLQEMPSEENLWQAVIAFQDYPFKTATGLPFRYKLKVGKNGEYNRELLIDRREKSKSLAWSSVVLAFENSKRISEEVKKPKALGDIRGVSYIYPILWRFGLLRVPEAIEKKMGKQR